MANAIIRDGKIYSESFDKVDVFEIVDKIPTGFFVWNIGDNMGHDEYIPVCQDLRPGDKDCFEINTRTLKAIKLSPEEVQLLRKAAGYGVNSKETAEKALRSKRKGRMSDIKRAHARKNDRYFQQNFKVEHRKKGGFEHEQK